MDYFSVLTEKGRGPYTLRSVTVIPGGAVVVYDHDDGDYIYTRAAFVTHEGKVPTNILCGGGTPMRFHMRVHGDLAASRRMFFAMRHFLDQVSPTTSLDSTTSQYDAWILEVDLPAPDARLILNEFVLVVEARGVLHLTQQGEG